MGNQSTIETALKTSDKASVGVTNPAHYAGTQYVEPIDAFRSVSANLANAYRYLARLGMKGGDNTVERDGKAAIWYCFDTLALVLEEDDGDYAPTLEQVAEFNINDFYTELYKFQNEQKRDKYGLAYSGHSQCAVVLAAIDFVLTAESRARWVGFDDQSYREHVMRVVATAFLAMNYAASTIIGKTLATSKSARNSTSRLAEFDYVSIYKGSKNYDFPASTRATIFALQSLLITKGLIEIGVRSYWNAEEDDD